MSDYANAVWMPNSNFFPDTGKKSFVIVHATAGGTSAEGIASFFQSTEGSSEPVSSHYIVGQDGHVVQTVLEANGAYGNGVVTNSNWNGNPNFYTISVEHVKPSTDNSDALTPAQQSASFALIKDICQRNGIGMHDADDSTGVTGHFSIDPVNRARCPNVYPWDALWAYLANGEDTPMTIDLSTPGVSNYFTSTGDPAVWQCIKTNFLVGHGILGFYQKFGGDALCGLTYLGLPTGPETGTGTAGTVYQRFERGVLAYDPSHAIDNPPQSGDVYLLHIDKGIGQDPQVAQLALENAQLKALPAVSNVLAVNKLAAQIVQKTQVQ
jgi:hypothetical protein